MKRIKIGIAGLIGALIIFLIISRPLEVPVKTEPNQELVAIPPNPFLDNLLDSLDSHVEAEIKKREVPGVAIAVVYQGKVVYRKAFGVRVDETIHPVDTNTVFRIASVSKGFTSVLTGTLVEDSVISWDDKVLHYLPEFALRKQENTDSLKIKHLLSHTSGLQYQAYTTLVEAGWSLDKMIRELRKASIISKTGEIYSYQNLAYSIVEPVLENATDDDFHDLMRRRIFEPLDMQNASLSFEEIMEVENKAYPHLFRGNGNFKKIKISPTYYNVSAAGGVNASISDMAKWLIALTGYRPTTISRDVLDNVFKPYVRTSTMERAFQRINKDIDFYYGLGWRVVHLPVDTIIYHGGYANGYRSGVALSNKEDIAIAILTNSSYDLPGEVIPDFFNLYYQKSDSIKAWRFKNYF